MLYCNALGYIVQYIYEYIRGIFPPPPPPKKKEKDPEKKGGKRGGGGGGGELVSWLALGLIIHLFMLLANANRGICIVHRISDRRQVVKIPFLSGRPSSPNFQIIKHPIFKAIPWPRALGRSRPSP